MLAPFERFHGGAPANRGVVLKVVPDDTMRGLELRKSPSVAETIDWGRTLLALGLDTLDEATVQATLGVVLKHQSDAVKAAAELRLN